MTSAGEPDAASTVPAACLGDLVAFARDAARNLVGVDPAGLTDAEVLALVEPVLALGEADPRVGEVLVALAAGNLDRAAWASLPADDSLAAAFIDEVAIRLGGFPVDCGLVARLALAPERTVLELAIRVDRSHGEPLGAAGVEAQPPERKQLATEVAMGVDDFLGLSAGGGQRGELPGDDSVVSTRATLVPRGLQLLSAFRAAERARRTFPGRAVEEAVWRYRPHEPLAFDWLLALLGSSSTGAGVVGPAGGRVCATGGATGACVDIPAGALAETVLVRIGLAPPELSPLLEPGRTAVGPLIEVDPGVLLSIPATLTLPYWPELLRILLVREEDVQALSADAGGGWSALDASRPSPGIVSTMVEHFSPYQVVVPAPGDVIINSLALADNLQDTAVLDSGVVYWTDRSAGVPVLVWQIGGFTWVWSPSVHGVQGELTAVAGVGSVLYVTTREGRPAVGRVYSFDPTAAATTLLAGGGADDGEGVEGALARLHALNGLAVGPDGAIYVAELIDVPGVPFGARVRRIAADGARTVTTVAGGTEAGFNGEDGPGTGVMLNLATDVEVSPVAMNGHLLFISDAGNNRIRALNVDATQTATLGGLQIGPGELATVVGWGSRFGPPSRDRGCVRPNPGAGGLLAFDVQLHSPGSVVVADQDLVIADRCNHRLLVMPLEATCPLGSPLLRSQLPCLPVTTLAGAWVDANGDGFPEAGFGGDGGRASEARLHKPGGLSWDAAGRRVVFADGFAHVRAVSFLDADGDWIGDSIDNCRDAPNPDQADANGDRVGDACDNCPDAPNDGQENTDGGPEGDACDPLHDSDGDGVADFEDNCPLDANPLVPRPGAEPWQPDLDRDGLGDPCDDDEDGDGIPNVLDTCGRVANGLAAGPDAGRNSDDDELGDACDPDDDDDGILDIDDDCPFTADPLQDDVNGDGLGDACAPDRDGDGLADIFEAGGDLGGETDPDSSDSDGDGLDDRAELRGCSDPMNPDTDGDGVPDGQDPSPSGDRPIGRVHLWRVTADLEFDFQSDNGTSARSYRGSIRSSWGLYISKENERRPPELLRRTESRAFRITQGETVFGTMTPASFTCEEEDESCRVELVPGGLVQEPPSGTPPSLIATDDQANCGHLITLAFHPFDPAPDMYLVIGDDGPSSTDWEDETLLGGALFDPAAGCTPEPIENQVGGSFPAIAKAPTWRLLKPEPFTLPVFTTRASDDCLGNVDPTSRLRLAGTLRFDPHFVASPEDVDEGRHRTPDSQFSFTNDMPGRLQLLYGLESTDGLPTDKELCWFTPAIGDSHTGPAPQVTSLTWLPESTNCARYPRPAPFLNPPSWGTGLTPVATYEGLPRRNDDFGRKTVDVDVLDEEFIDLDTGGPVRLLVAEGTFEVFYERLAQNNPGPPTGPLARDPNWFYYRTQQPPWPEAPPNCTGTAVKWDPCIPRPGGNAAWQMPAAVDGDPFENRILVCDRTALESNHALQGILVHEFAHREHFCTVVWSGNYDASADPDRDWLSTTWETAHPDDCVLDERDWETCFAELSHPVAEDARRTYCYGQYGPENRDRDCKADWAASSSFPGCQWGTAVEAQDCPGLSP